MSFLFIQKYNFFILLLALQLKIILSEEEKCYSIYNCKICPELDICEKCNKGYILNEDKSKCILEEIKSSSSGTKSSPEIIPSKSSEKSSAKESISSFKKSSTKESISSSQKSSAKQSISSSQKSSVKQSISSSQKSSAKINKPSAEISKQKKSSSSPNAQKSIKSSQKSSNNNIQKITPPPFIQNINQFSPKPEKDNFYTRITLYWLGILAVVLVILLILYCSRKAWSRVGYNYCDDGDEMSRIVYIR